MFSYPCVALDRTICLTPWCDHCRTGTSFERNHSRTRNAVRRISNLSCWKVAFGMFLSCSFSLIISDFFASQGFSTKMHLPTNRGFDYFYGFVSADEDYYTKRVSESRYYYDFRENMNLINASLVNNTHNAYLFETKAESIIKSHAKNYPTKPMFLYYAMQLIHWFVYFTCHCLVLDSCIFVLVGHGTHLRPI